jgi:hypothetical protein
MFLSAALQVIFPFPLVIINFLGCHLSTLL